MNICKKLLFVFIAVGNNLNSYKINSEIKKIDELAQKIILTFDLNPSEILYKDGFVASINNANFNIAEPKTQEQAVSFFDKKYNATKNGYKNKVKFEFTVTKNSQILNESGIVNINFFVNSDSKPQQYIIKLDDTNTTNKENSSISSVKVETQKDHVPEHPTAIEIQSSWFSSFIKSIIDYISQLLLKWRNLLSGLFTSTGSRAIRFLVALILGLLLSFTPCIYPMIPITIGVLQASSSKSKLSNFFLAASYTLGISFTFSILGLIAAFGSAVFGTMQGSPWVIIPLVIILGYLGLAMFGFYEMYIPRFLQPKSTDVKGGSYLSAFTFGAISGTVASPCMSPGLALILDWVSNLSATGSTLAYIEGFVLLFAFGIGSSLPLLIIGTFTTSTNILPKAGLWMVEVKKILGLMLIGMCFYHLSHMPKYLPWYVLVFAIAITLLFFGIYYFYTIYDYDTVGIKRFKNFMGVILIVSACIMFINGLKAVYNQFYHKMQTDSQWHHDYEKATQIAMKENKKILLDIGSTYCGACKSVDSSIFKNPDISKILGNYVLVKIESDLHENEYNSVLKLFESYIKKTGFPTILIVDPNNNNVIKHWGNDIKDYSIEEIASQLNNQSVA